MDNEIREKAKELYLNRMNIAIEQGVTDEGKQATKEAMEVFSKLNELEKIDVEREKLVYEEADRSSKLEVDHGKLNLDYEKLDLDKDRLKVEESKNQHNIWYEVVIPVGIEAGKFIALTLLAVGLTKYEKTDIVSGQPRKIFDFLTRIK